MHQHLIANYSCATINLIKCLKHVVIVLASFLLIDEFDNFLTNLRQNFPIFWKHMINQFTNYRGIFHQNRNMVSKVKSPTSEFTNFGSHQLRGMTVYQFLSNSLFLKLICQFKALFTKYVDMQKFKSINVDTKTYNY